MIKALLLILEPLQAWDRVARSQRSFAYVFFLFLLPMIGLSAAAEGYASSYLNQPLELPGLRQQLRDELRLAGWPQLILRLGRPAGPLPPPATRRPAGELLIQAV